MNNISDNNQNHIPDGAVPGTQLDRGAPVGTVPGTQLDHNAPQNGAVPGTLPDRNMPEYREEQTEIDVFKAAAAAQVQQLTSESGTVYAVERVLSEEGGEAAVLLCSRPDGSKAVAKIFFQRMNRWAKARKLVYQYMQTEEGRKYTVAVTDFGKVTVGNAEHHFEISNFCPEGDLRSAGAYSFEELVELIRHLNEAIHSIHKAGILHRDLKLDNLYKSGGSVLIGDFGVATEAGGGATGLAPGTEGYQAPETLFSATSEKIYYFDEKSDYYSFGVCIASLFEGQFVYKNVPRRQIQLAYQRSRLPMTSRAPGRDLLDNLVCGLVQYDAENRFGYEDVCKWLDNHNYKVMERTASWTYGFGSAECSSRQELFEAITADPEAWEEGRRRLYEQYFSDFFRLHDPNLAAISDQVEEQWRTVDPDKGLAVFLKKLYPQGPIVWRGNTFLGLAELGGRMVQSRQPEAYGEFLQKRCVSHWLKHTTGISVSEETKELVDRMEELSQTEPELACYWFGNSFAGERLVRICGKEIHTMEQLLDAMFSNPRDFYFKDAFEQLTDRKAGAMLYGFLFSLGCGPLADACWEKMANTKDFDAVVLLLTMLDTAAGMLDVDAAVLRRFFTEYGPVGIFLCTQELVRQENHAVYQPLDGSGRDILGKISDFRPSGALDSVDHIYEAYKPLGELVESLHRKLMDNPFCIAAGVYNDWGVMARDLSGCFGFRLFGKAAPLAMQARIEGAGKEDAR